LYDVIVAFLLTFQVYSSPDPIPFINYLQLTLSSFIITQVFRMIDQGFKNIIFKIRVEFRFPPLTT